MDIRGFIRVHHLHKSVRIGMSLIVHTTDRQINNQIRCVDGRRRRRLLTQYTHPHRNPFHSQSYSINEFILFYRSFRARSHLLLFSRTPKRYYIYLCAGKPTNISFEFPCILKVLQLISFFYCEVRYKNKCIFWNRIRIVFYDCPIYIYLWLCSKMWCIE